MINKIKVRKLMSAVKERSKWLKKDRRADAAILIKLFKKKSKVAKRRKVGSTLTLKYQKSQEDKVKVKEAPKRIRLRRLAKKK